MTAILAGAYDYVAAEAAGVPDRTFRDWMARGEGRHPTRRSTPELRAFAAEVRQARAEARLAREIEVAQSDPKFWLTRAARSRPGREGWTDPLPEPAEAPWDQSAAASARAQAPEWKGYSWQEPSDEDIAETIQILIDAGVLACQCPDHGECMRGDDG